MPRINFHQQLEQLKDKLLAMAALSQQAVEYAVDAYLERDQRLCTFVRENEAAINMAQRDVDEMAYELLAKEQPMAIDLRFILAVIKINADLERVGDGAKSISDRVRTMDSIGTTGVIKRMLTGSMPGVPRIGLEVVDVRDLADIHIRAMVSPAAAGERFLATGEFTWMRDMAQTLRDGLGPAGAKVSTRQLPDLKMSWATPRSSPVTSAALPRTATPSEKKW